MFELCIVNGAATAVATAARTTAAATIDGTWERFQCGRGWWATH